MQTLLAKAIARRPELTTSDCMPRKKTRANVLANRASVVMSGFLELFVLADAAFVDAEAAGELGVGFFVAGGD